MSFSLFALIASGLTTSLKAIMVVLILRHRVLKRWPFFFALCVVELSRAAAAAWLHTGAHRVAYFYMYWITAALVAALNFGIMFDALRAIPGIVYLPHNFRIFAASVTGSIFLVTGILTFQDHVISSPWASLAIDLQRCSDYCWLSVFSRAFGNWEERAFSRFIYLKCAGRQRLREIVAWSHNRPNHHVISNGSHDHQGIGFFS